MAALSADDAKGGSGLESKVGGAAPPPPCCRGPAEDTSRFADSGVSHRSSYTAKKVHLDSHQLPRAVTPALPASPAWPTVPATPQSLLP